MKAYSYFILISMSLRGFLAIMVVLVWLGAIYTGYVTMMKRVLRSAPQPNNTRSLRLQREQKEKIRDIRERQKRLMEDRKNRLRDMQRR